MPRSQRTASQARIWHLQHLALAQGWLRQASCLCVTQAVRFSDHWRILELAGAMWPLLWATVRAYAPYVTFPVAFVVGAVGYHLEWFIRGQPPPPALEDEKSISERREDRTLQESAGKDLTQVVSLKEKMEFAPRAVLNRNRPEKN
ncbi:small integral membrane protein 12 isoform X2 [Anolis carolinensis]